MQKSPRRGWYVWILAATVLAMPARGAQPVTITFEDITNKPFGHDILPPFVWRGVEFSGGALWQTETLGTWYMARNRNSIELKFPPGSTDISFDVDGRGNTIFLPDLMPIQVWNGPIGSTLVATLPLPASLPDIFPPKHKVTIPGPASVITMLSAPAPSGIRDVFNTITLDNIRYTPPDPEPSITFDTVLPAHTRVLTHNYGNQPYPSPLQTQDGTIRVDATVLVNGQPAPGKTIHFRMIDPADPSPYVTMAGDDFLGDNVDGPGSLNGPGKTTASGVSDGNGRVSVTLEVTSFAAGDNYQIEASGNGTFPCGTACAKSVVYTAWKRIYVEYNKMFRKGAFLTKDAPAGAKEIQVDDVRSFPSPPFEIRMLHAAPVNAPAADFATGERVTIVKVKKDKTGLLAWLTPGPEPGKLFLDPNPGAAGLQRTYFGPESINATPRPYLADGVGLVTGNRAADFFLVNGTLSSDLFERAYVESIWLTDATASDADLLPSQPRAFYDGVLPFNTPVGGEKLDSHQREWLTRKWAQYASRAAIERAAAPNHQIVFTTGQFWKFPKSLDTHLGLTHVGTGLGDSWIAVEEIGSQSRLAEATAHELAHQWRVNHGGANPKAGGGHAVRLSIKPH